MKDAISITVCTEKIASCNSCRARNYVSCVDKAPADVEVLYELNIGNMCNRLCKNCLEKIAEKTLEVLK